MLLLLPALPGFTGQEKEPLRIRVESRLVLVDLIVTDAGGNFVADLKPEDIEIFEDNKRRSPAFLELRRVGSALDAAGGPGYGTAVATGAASTGAVLFFLVDLESISAPDLARVKQSIREFVRSSADGRDRLMLATVRRGLHILHPASRNSAAFVEALEAMVPPAEPNARLPRFAQGLEDILVELGPDRHTPVPYATHKEFVRRALTLAREYLAAEEANVRSVCENAAAFSRDIGTLPGRKNLVFISGGYRPRIGFTLQDLILARMEERWPADSSAHMRELQVQVRSLLGASQSASTLASFIRAAAEEANRARISYHAVDARGLLPADDVQLRAHSSQSAKLLREEIHQPQSFLGDLADRTGGSVLVNSNDLSTGFRRAYRSSTEYYELGYVPVARPDKGGLHRIRINLLRSGLQAVYRQEYNESRGTEPESRAVENAFKFPGLFEDFPVDVRSSVSQNELQVEVLVPTSSLAFTRSKDRYRCDLSVYMALFDSEGRLYGSKVLFSRSYALDFSEAERAGIGNYRNVTASHRAKVAPGNYRLRVVVRQNPAGRTAAWERRITF